MSGTLALPHSPRTAAGWPGAAVWVLPRPAADVGPQRSHRGRHRRWCVQPARQAMATDCDE